ncbi:hypothetical protein B6U98_01090 [Thermoplasmatales archaeon ex4572_165]|nr:MAG: hypothetical protein B6U98_01090 [Thermoplasmatales archaeon ex4572_165]RLF59785.1 MAG: hypothetical protein DRN27_01545 [Thermoplasmata archaeon]
MKNRKGLGKAGFFIIMISIMLVTPTLTALSFQRNTENKYNPIEIYTENTESINSIDITKTTDMMRYLPSESVSLADEQNDIGYNIDAGDTLRRSYEVYIGEPVNEKIPGRGRTGTLDPDEGDDADCYRFTACEGQTIISSVSPSQFVIEIYNGNEEIIPSGNVAGETGWFFINIYSINDQAGEYTFNVILQGQNDADSGSDAGNSIGSAIKITTGSHVGYLDYNDWEDWYSFDVSSGSGIFVEVKPEEESDFDIHLYNPNGEHVHSAQFYGEDILEYPADITGTWKIQIDIFPGWDESKWPDNYYLYGSGVYELELSLGGEAEAPPSLKPLQNEIIPIAQTFIINDDQESTKDEYGYLAAIPAANYIENGKRYVSPIVYQGNDIIPNWFTSIDDTTQYLLDDWNTYLDRHDLTPQEYLIPLDPIQAAADIATQHWETVDTAVLAIDGSNFEDIINIVIDQDVSLSCEKETDRFLPGDLTEFSSDFYSKTMYIGSKWAAIYLQAEGDEFAGDTMVLTPRYEAFMADWWPHDSGSNGADKDTFFPITKPGIWVPHVTDIEGLEALTVMKYSGNRHTIDVGPSDSSLKVTLSTQSESDLIAYLIDPEGNVRRPQYPHWNGGEIKPIHQWNGGHWEHDEDEYRHMIIDPHTEFSVEIHNPMQGTWTALVVPYLNLDTWDASFDGSYHIQATIREHNPNRVAAGLSAANAAVLASQKHVPLLYVNENEVPSETSNTLTELGISNIIFVNIDDVSAASPSGTVTKYSTLQDVITAIKTDSNSENVITVTSFATGDGYFGPSGMIAAFHGSPVINIAEAKDAYNTIDMYQTYREFTGDYYHGTRSLGHLPMMDEPIGMTNPPSLLDLIIYFFTNDQTLPPFGLDLKMQWLTTVYDDLHSLIDEYGLDNEGQEIYIFVSPRDTDIRDSIGRAMTGNNSYAGLIPVETTAFSSAIIVRNILYPALIYANPGKDVTTSQHMNYFTGQYDHTGNDGVRYTTYAPRDNKNSFSSFNRFYEGHCMWENFLERYNKGALISIYSGHGTGGSGISSQYKNMKEQFPLAEPYHESLYDFEWWDSWAGYSGYDERQTKTIRDQSMSIYNAEEPSLYDLIHFKWVDQLFENLHSEIDIWSSCTTTSHFGPIVYLSHGTALYAGCLGSGYTLVDDLYKTWILRDVLIKGYTLGEAFSQSHWIVNRDFTTGDPSSVYGSASFFADGISSNNVIFGDPTLQVYNPTWVEPVPILS